MRSSLGDVSPFDSDAAEGGYVYTRDEQLSCRIARERHVTVLLEEVALAGRRVLDIGCGDGFNTIALYDRGHPASMVGIDPAAAAVDLARTRVDGRDIHFQAMGSPVLPFAGDEFDVAMLVGVLHHVADPARTIGEAARVAREVVLLEPNGWNAGLKVIEKVSPYHRAHNEKSYTSRRIAGWLAAAGTPVVSIRFAGLVPFFCPDWMARTLKLAAPLVEATPGLRAAGCAFTVLRGGR